MAPHAIDRYPPFVIAVQPDDYPEPGNASSEIWTRLLRELGHQVRPVNVRRADILAQLDGCDGFMWRFGHWSSIKQIARRLLPVIERELGLATYPSQATAWHYDDKIAQSYLLWAAGVSTPPTWVWFDRHAARRWARAAEYPLVLKLTAGAGSSNVRLVKSPDELDRWIGRLFGRGVTTLATPSPTARARAALVRRAAAIHPRGGTSTDSFHAFWEVQRDYLLVQKFLPDNPFDTRVTVIGDRAFGFRRMNRPDDFRASGSGAIDHDPGGVDLDMVRLAFRTAATLGAQSLAIDGLFDGNEAVVGEISYTYLSSAVQRCPGHWDRDLRWHPGPMWPEEAQVEDFLHALFIQTSQHAV